MKYRNADYCLILMIIFCGNFDLKQDDFHLKKKTDGRLIKWLAVDVVHLKL